MKTPKFIPLTKSLIIIFIQNQVEVVGTFQEQKIFPRGRVEITTLIGAGFLPFFCPIPSKNTVTKDRESKP